MRVNKKTDKFILVDNHNNYYSKRLDIMFVTNEKLLPLSIKRLNYL